MAAPEGNQFWKARSSHGRNPIFATPGDLWAACEEYFQWVEDNPLKKTELVTYQGDAKAVEVPLMRAMTVEGLCIFLDIGRSTWDDYVKRDDFSGVASRVQEVLRTQKFTGAAAGLLNANIIARDLGLAEKSDMNHGGQSGNPIETVTKVEWVVAKPSE